LGPEKRGRYAEGCLKKSASDWPLWLETGLRLAVFTGGCYSAVVFRTGLTVYKEILNQHYYFTVTTFKIIFIFSKHTQSNQSTTTTLGTAKKWLLW
jgi:hypothetical protein